jgi:Glycosyl hydrolase family 76
VVIALGALSALTPLQLGPAASSPGERLTRRQQQASPTESAAAATAKRAYAAMRRRFAIGGGLYSDLGRSHASVWPLSQALAASLSIGSLAGRAAAAARAEALRTVRALAHYRLGQAYNSTARPPLGRGGALYYDDNNWIALDLLAAYRLFGQRALLRRAEGVFAFLVSGWDGSAGAVCPGGIFWVEAPTSQIRTTVSTANAALVALRLYQATKKRTYLAWALRMYGWVSRCLSAPNGLYFDHLDSRGDVGRDEWTYNQGAMVAAGVLLAHATGERSYLNQALTTAKAALAHYRASGYAGEPPILVAIYFDDLHVLEQAGRLSSYRNALHSYIRHRVPLRANGRFGYSLLQQAAAVQLYAALTGSHRLSS